jgi:DegV family protein with EDD domain
MRLTTENTAIVLDSTADFPEARERYPNMRVVPLYVRFGEESFRDYVDIDPHTFYTRLRTVSSLPTTSQPTPQDFLAAYEELAGYERIYSLHLSSRLSGTFRSAELAAEEAGGDRIRVVDTETASAAVTMLALAIQRRLRLARGCSDEEIEALIERYKREAEILFTVDTLEFLAKGGRIGRAKALAGNLLHVKPILTIEEGEIVPVTRVRGRRKALEEFGRRFSAATSDRPGLHVGIAHAEAEGTVEELRAVVAAARPQAEIEIVTTLGAVVGTHAGPGTVGFFWFADGAS